MKPDFLGFVGVHPLDEAFPFGIHRPRAVRLVDDDKLSTGFEHPFHLTKAMLDVGPQLDGLEGGD